jgi:hypothetical protein
MWWTVFSLLVVAGLVGESHRRLRAVRALWQLAAPYLGRGAPPPLAADTSATEQRAWVADLNEATIEIGAGIERAGIVPKSCAKAALSLGALVALLESTDLVRGDAPPLWVAPAISFLGGCVGAVGCLFIGRAAEAEARRLRGDWAALIRRSVRDVSELATERRGTG